MLKLSGQQDRNSRFCDGFSRRSLLNIGTLAAMGTAGGWTLPSILKAEEATGRKTAPKSVIMIYLVGGPPHQDMFDLKPEAPGKSPVHGSRSPRLFPAWKSAKHSRCWQAWQKN